MLKPSVLFFCCLALSLSYAHLTTRINPQPENAPVLGSPPTAENLCEPQAPTLLFPSNLATNIQPNTLMRWDTVAATVTYDLQLATDAGFTELVVDTTGLPYALYNMVAPLDTSSTFHWRVRAVNDCGAGPWSVIRRFSTSNLLCFILKSTDVPVVDTTYVLNENANEHYSSLFFPHCGIVRSVAVRDVYATSSQAGQMNIVLMSPNYANSPLSVYNYSCFPQDRVAATYDEDNQVIPINCAARPGYVYRPYSSFVPVYGRPAQGEWRMAVITSQSSQRPFPDTLHRWTLDVCITPTSGEPRQCFRDRDNDGFGEASDYRYECSTCPAGWVDDATDCYDYNSEVYPNATELCNGVDDNCNGLIDEGFDADGDGYLPCAYGLLDCDDTNASIHPNAEEICNDLDDNCNGLIDETNFFENRQVIGINYEGRHSISSTIQISEAPSNYANVVVYVDIYHSFVSDLVLTLTNPAGDSAVLVSRICGAQDDLSLAISLYDGSSPIDCPPNWGRDLYFEATDPNAFAALFAPGTGQGDWVLKVHDIFDEDGGLLNSWSIHYLPFSAFFYQDLDADGYGNDQVASYCPSDTTSNWVTRAGDCDDNNPIINPETVWYIDRDDDGYRGTQTRQACIRPAQHKLASELFSFEIDCNDNNAAIIGPAVWYADADGDGYSGGDSLLQCTRPSGYFSAQELIALYADCNDNNAAVSPVAQEICDGIDNNCDGITDPADATSIEFTEALIGEGLDSGSLDASCGGSEYQFSLTAEGVASTPTYDNLYFTYLQMCNNSEIIARVSSFEGSGWAGIMIRETLLPGAKKVTLATRLENKVRREMRLQNNATTLSYITNRPGAVWLRLKRTGNSLAGYTSTTGELWTSLFTRVISMQGCVYLGLFVEDGTGLPTQAAFQDVSITGTPPALNEPNGSLSTSHRNAVQPQLYPNPTGGEFVVSLAGYDSPEGWIDIYDALGRPVERRRLSGAAEEYFLLDAEAGVYQVVVKVGHLPPTTLRLVKLD